MGKINLIEILKDVPKGTKLWSNLCGECEFEKIIENSYITVVHINTEIAFTKEGKFRSIKDAECVLWPSKEIRDWSRWKEELKWREIEKWIADGICEFNGVIDSTWKFRPIKSYKHYDFTKMRSFQQNSTNKPWPDEDQTKFFRKKPEVNPYQHLNDAIAEGKLIELNTITGWVLIPKVSEHDFYSRTLKEDNDYAPELYRVYDPYRELKEAYERGEVIQCCDKDYNEWHQTISPIFWNLSVDRYRVKPKKPKYIPFTFEDREMFRDRWIRNKSNNTSEYAIVQIMSDGFKMSQGYYSEFQSAFKKFEFTDGTPFGKISTE